ncbi:MAG: acyl-CoA dehydrogenase family protein [Thermoanaerobaculia bacterium]
MSDSHIPSPLTDSYWHLSPTLQAILLRKLGAEEFTWAEPRFEEMGKLAAVEVAPRAAIADRESPVLVSFDARGERIDRVEYHPAYRTMERIAYGSGMIGMKYDPQVRRDHPDSVQLVGFGLGYLFAMAEAGLYCPACMTDGVARVLERHGTPDQIERVVPHLTAKDRPELWTGAMFLTERIGGSDVGANEAIARRGDDGQWRLSGLKWFCSNVDAEAALVTARTDGGPAGTRGIRTFLLLTRDNPGVRIDRLKEKLGVRSMPTGEVTLTDAIAEEVGGFAPITDMLNLSRLYNAVASVAVMGRAIAEAQHYVERRRAFGRTVVEHPLAAETLADLEAEHVAALYLTFEAVEAIGRADRGDAEAALLLRILTPIAKLTTGKLAVPIVSEALELIGGNGYIEESPMPRLLRDAQVLPIWEGTTNILILDTLRAARKEGAHKPMLERIQRHFPEESAGIEQQLGALEEREARGWVDRLVRAFQLALLVEGNEGATVERLAPRPLGILPGAKPRLGAPVSSPR